MASTTKVGTGIDALQIFAEGDALSEFLNDGFNVQDYTVQVIENSTISARLLQLMDGISLLDKELHSQISTRHEDLLAQATGIESLEGVLAMMHTRIESLQSTVDRIRSKVSEPFQKIQSRTIQLGRLQATCDLLRSIIRIQRLSGRLRGQLHGGVREITKAAQTLNELDYLTLGVDLSGIEVIEKDRIFLQISREEVSDQAGRLLHEGLRSVNQAQTATALQVFFNLNTLKTQLQKTTDEMILTANQNINYALDHYNLNNEVSHSHKGPGSAVGMHTNTAIFRVNLWNNIEHVIHQISTSSVQMIHLQKVLAKKRDPLTHVEFIDELRKHGYDCNYVAKFWKSVTQNFYTQLDNSAQESNLMRQAFEGEYPKLVQLFSDLWERVAENKNLLQGDFQNREWENNHANDAEESLKISLKLFERSYLQRSLSRLFDPINLMFPTGGRTPPNEDEIKNVVKTISSELGVAIVDKKLAVQVGKNVAKTLQLFAVKSEQLISTQGEASQVIAPPTQAQLRNIATVNSLHILQTTVVKILEEHENLPPETMELIHSSADDLSQLIASATEPLLSAVHDSVQCIILTIHNEDFGRNDDVRGESTLCSLYMKELCDFLSRVVKDHFTKFICHEFVRSSLIILAQCGIEMFVRHASLVRPIGEEGKARLSVDFAQMEVAVSLLCQRIADLGHSYRLLRAFRPLLFQTDEAVSLSPSIGDVIPFSTALHYLFSRAPSNLRSPYQVMEWSVGRYSKWLDDHKSEKERLNMIRGTIENYVSRVRSSNDTSFADVYPKMVALLQRGMDK